MKTLKSYVRNYARPEGCIAESYLVDECMKYFKEYIHRDVEVNATQSRNEEFEDEVIIEGRPLSKGTSKRFSDEMLRIVHRYVLFNVAEAEPFIE